MSLVLDVLDVAELPWCCQQTHVQPPASNELAISAQSGSAQQISSFHANPNKGVVVTITFYSMGTSSSSGESSSAHQSEGSFMSEAAVSAKNTSIFFIRRLPISGLCWTTYTINNAHAHFHGSTYRVYIQYRDHLESLESGQHHSTRVSNSLRPRSLEMAIVKSREHSPSTSWPETLSVSNSFQG